MSTDAQTDLGAQSVGLDRVPSLAAAIMITDSMRPVAACDHAGVLGGRVLSKIAAFGWAITLASWCASFLSLVRRGRGRLLAMTGNRTCPPGRR
jgi:hypothetical protein